MKSFFIRREVSSKCSKEKDAWTVWFGHELTQTEQM